MVREAAAQRCTHIPFTNLLEVFTKLTLANEARPTPLSPQRDIYSTSGLCPLTKMNPNSSVVKTCVSFFENIAKQGLNKPSKVAVIEDEDVFGSDEGIYDGAFAMDGLAEALDEEVANEAAIVVYKPPVQAGFSMGKANPKPKKKKVKQGPKRAYSISAVNKKIREEKTSITKYKKRLEKLNRELDALADQGAQAKDDNDQPLWEAVMETFKLKEVEAARVSKKIHSLRQQVDPRVAAREKVKALLKSVK
jgi:hypothetical protein